MFAPRILTPIVAFLGVLALAAPPSATAAPSTQVPTAPVDQGLLDTQVEPGVARIDTTIPFQGALGAGTGIVLSPGGEVLTNFHVVQGAETITATVDGRRFDADLAGYDRSNDIALLRLRGARDLRAVPIGSVNDLARGESVVALGNANGTGSPVTREQGTVTGFGREITARDELTGNAEQLTGLVEFGAPVRAGDSGGPLVDDAGRVVGITTAASQTFEMQAGGEGFAIPIDRAIGIAGQIRSGAPTATVHIGPPALLGVGVSAAAGRPGTGVIAGEVLRGGPADAAGLRPGDLITSVDGQAVDSGSALTSVLDRRVPGDTVDVTFVDTDGNRQVTRATLAA
ncbi:S1C family serine protease [Mycolicibacterium sediminis]|uniref:Trypsin n=1 Tax=Mycolicibacterium sediminis TaxID=1286180 RepID=A0A7I7QU82_9MYCO|nr:trypsin-like peptidase domain-containing protein [Mycolicibacterium sediminis]BBY29537.1 trypsin [Mycolicibacterium sediminis]